MNGNGRDMTVGKVMSGLKGQDCFWFGCDVVHQERAAAGCILAEWQLATQRRDRPVKAGSDLQPTHIAAQLEWT